MLSHVNPRLVLVLALAVALQGCAQSAAPSASAKQPESAQASAPFSSAGPALAATDASVPSANTHTVSAAPGAASASQRPTLKPGLWRVEDGVFDGLVESGKAFICIDAATESMINRGPAEFVGEKCNTSEGDKEQVYLGRTVCELGDRTVVTRVRIDDGQIYFRDVITQAPGAKDDSGKKVSDYAEWTAACSADQKPGQAFAQAYGQTAMKPVDLPERLKPAVAAK